MKDENKNGKKWVSDGFALAIIKLFQAGSLDDPRLEKTGKALKKHVSSKEHDKILLCTSLIC